MATIQERIKELRTENGYTQEELAKLLGLNSKSNIANYENGANSPSDKIKLKMCKLFNCSMDYLMGLTSYENPKEELEKKLYNFNLTEDEYNDAINCFMTNDIQALSFVLLFSTEQNSKEYNVLLTILAYVSDYISDIKLPNDKSTLDPLVKDNFQKEIERAYVPAKKLLLSLDKNKIIHNYKENMNNKNYYMTPVYGQISAGQPNLVEENIEGRIPIDTDLMDIYNPEEYFFLRVNGESMNKVIKNGAFALIHKQDTVENGEIAVVLVNGYDATLKKFTKQGDLIILEPNSTDESFETQVYDKTTSIKILGKYVGKLEING